MTPRATLKSKAYSPKSSFPTNRSVGPLSKFTLPAGDPAMAFEASVHAEREQHVTGTATERAVSGIDEQHTARNRRSRAQH